MKFKLGYYEDETVMIDMRNDHIEVKFKYAYSQKGFKNTLEIIESIVDALNDLNEKRDQPERSKREEVCDCRPVYESTGKLITTMRCSEHCGNTVRDK